MENDRTDTRRDGAAEPNSRDHTVRISYHILIILLKVMATHHTQYVVYQPFFVCMEIEAVIYYKYLKMDSFQTTTTAAIFAEINVGLYCETDKKASQQTKVLK